MVETTGIEPVTPCMSSKYSNQLSYASIASRSIIITQTGSFVKPIRKVFWENGKKSGYRLGKTVSTVLISFRFCAAAQRRRPPE